MYAGLFELNSWMGKEQYVFVSDTATDLLNKFERVQDLSCLIAMGMDREDEAGKESLERLKELLNKHYSGQLTIDELKLLDVQISLGSFKCVDIIEGDDAEKLLREKFPDAK